MCTKKYTHKTDVKHCNNYVGFYENMTNKLRCLGNNYIYNND